MTKIEILKRLNELSAAERLVRQSMKRTYGAEYEQLERQLDEIDIERQYLETKLDEVQAGELARGVNRT